MGKTFQRPEAMADTITHYCPGCTHGVAHRWYCAGGLRCFDV
jgi:2-oxoglutarate ferredoxin oxidoreductase subunit beta